ILRVGQQGFVRAEAWEGHVVSRHPAHLSIDGYADVREVLGEPQVKRAGSPVITAKVKVQAGTTQGVQWPLHQSVQVDAKQGAVEGLGRACPFDPERMDAYCGTGAKLAGHVVHGFGEQPRSLGDAL